VLKYSELFALEADANLDSFSSVWILILKSHFGEREAKFFAAEYGEKKHKIQVESFQRLQLISSKINEHIKAKFQVEINQVEEDFSQIIAACVSYRWRIASINRDLRRRT
jgi:hypothetical protein